MHEDRSAYKSGEVEWLMEVLSSDLAFVFLFLCYGGTQARHGLRGFVGYSMLLRVFNKSARSYESYSHVLIKPRPRPVGLVPGLWS